LSKTGNSIVLPENKGVWCPLVGNLLLSYFFLTLIVPSPHFAIPTSHVTVIFSHLVAPLLFSNI